MQLASDQLSGCMFWGEGGAGNMEEGKETSCFLLYSVASSSLAWLGFSVPWGEVCWLNVGLELS